MTLHARAVSQLRSSVSMTEVCGQIDQQLFVQPTTQACPLAHEPRYSRRRFRTVLVLRRSYLGLIPAVVVQKTATLKRRRPPCTQSRRRSLQRRLASTRLTIATPAPLSMRPSSPMLRRLLPGIHPANLLASLPDKRVLPQLPHTPISPPSSRVKARIVRDGAWLLPTQRERVKCVGCSAHDGSSRSTTTTATAFTALLLLLPPLPLLLPPLLLLLLIQLLQLP